MSRKLSNWIDGFLAYTSNSEPRESYRKWVAISAIASALQRKCKLVWGTETFYPNMYIVLVGPPAARKGTAMKVGKNFLDQLGISYSADETSRQALIKQLHNALTPNQGADGRLNYHASLTVFSSELTVFIGYESKELLSVLCKLYDCENYVKDTISRGEENVPNTWLNLLGATTPGQLQASVPEGFIASGFTSRVVFVYEDDKERIVIRPELSTEQKKIGDLLLQDLGEIHTLVGEFKTSNGFEEEYSIWRYESESNQLFADPRLEYYTQRRPLHLFKLCMIYSAARSDSMLIEMDDLYRAITTLSEVEKNMPKVFRGIGSNPLAGIQVRLLKVLEEKGEISLSQVSQMFFSDASHSQLGESIASLEQMGVCLIDVVKKKLIYKGDK